MFKKALWFQNYKQSRFVLGILFVLFVIQMPLQAILTIETWNERAAQADQAEEYVYEVQSWEVEAIFSDDLFSLMVSGAILLLALVLVGLERNTRRNDFTFALPFTRTQLYLAKWLLGTGTILLFFLLNFFPSYFIIQQSDFSYALTLITAPDIFWGPLLGYLFFFSFCLFIASLTGEMMSQTIITLVTAFLPQIIFTLLQELMRVHDFFLFTIGAVPRWVDYLTPGLYAVGEMSDVIGMSLSCIFIGLTLWAGIFFYHRNRVEYNGEFLLFKQMTVPTAVLLVILVAFFGGMIVSSLAPWGANALRIISYWIGFCTFLLFALIVTRRLLTMNVRFFGKAL
ncbi:hypothetical protein [Alkalicoccus urumqiensis]|uniref:ABC transporter permease n=1 Tax=Alkalicoccus urumqiensis TaxID=1548213 RepID=A0A2P6MEF5_ALKUR|nr:hypothetical protein [Alkalicoccus urumqiensis]PRO64669.1 hypothetical protein C6I21_13260 [Alkalicoccus urumqiensis]